MLSDFISTLTVLYVEDDASIRESFAKILDRRFGNVLVAKDGIEGLALYKAQNPDVVITDIKMPVMDGLQMSRSIRDVDSEVYLIVVSAFSDKELLLKAIDIGVNGYLSKPVEKKELSAQILSAAKLIHAERELAAKNQYIQDIIDFQENFIFIIRDDIPVLINQNLLEYFSCKSVENFIEQRECLCYQFEPTEGYYSVEEHEEWLKALKRGEADNKKVVIKSPMGIDRIFLMRQKSFPQSPNEYILSLTDITELEKRSQEFERLANTDLLTGLYNRLYFNDQLSAQLRKKLPDDSYSILMFDLDHFKMVNDRFGHQVGDTVLKRFSEIIGENIRGSDVFARWGGEEFLLLVPEMNASVASGFANKLCQMIETADFPSLGETMTVSIGYTSNKLDDTMENMIERADRALYQAKKNGRNQVVFEG